MGWGRGRDGKWKDRLLGFAVTCEIDIDASCECCTVKSSYNVVIAIEAILHLCVPCPIRLDRVCMEIIVSFSQVYVAFYTAMKVKPYGVHFMVSTIFHKFLVVYILHKN